MIKNNKGFAITTILYALVLMLSLILFLLIGLQSFGKKANDDLVKTVTKELNQCLEDESC